MADGLQDSNQRPVNVIQLARNFAVGNALQDRHQSRLNLTPGHHNRPFSSSPRRSPSLIPRDSGVS